MGGVKVGDAGTKEIQSGFLTAMECAVHGRGGPTAETGITLEMLEGMKEELEIFMEDAIPKDGVNLHGLEIIHPKFCWEVTQVYAKAIERVRSKTTFQTGNFLVRQSSFETVEFLKVREVDEDCQSLHPSVKSSLGRVSRISSRLHVDDDLVPMTPTAEQVRTDIRPEFEARREDIKIASPDPVDSKAESFMIRVRSHTEDDTPEPTEYYAIEKLACLPPWPPGVTPQNREQWLSPEDFFSLFQMNATEFAKLPLWKQRDRKRKVKLF